jgi:hypothetical protein
MWVMAKGWTDAKFEVVNGPRQRYELPAWFKRTMLALASLLMLATAVTKQSDLHPTAPPQAVGGGSAAQPAPPAPPP